ncbi:hypothetical protein PV682_04425 [Streptomyces niveiscabiei]|uniref:hypothetical protein n=1 Tax=Streptomyces niveiscabiei TaxID=164115 RepID=UPI0029A90688|nr:hypothetical protein [Streptomyces niveiscabiei]MDX3380693.1 hypothetical protein [Streptomyces niveiscabiei]
MTVNSLKARARWFRVCWTVTENGRTVEHGTLTGRNVPNMLVSLRDCLPISTPNPDAVNAAVGTPEGWRFDSNTISVHTHQVPLQGHWLPFATCPERRKGGDA